MPQDSHTWRSYFQAAQGDHRVGDLLVLTEEAPSDRERMESHRTAGMALMDGGQFKLAREQFEAALSVGPADTVSKEYFHKLAEPVSESIRKVEGVPLTPSWQPRLVFLFTGQMIDKKGRSEPRFPPDKEPIEHDHA